MRLKRKYRISLAVILLMLLIIATIFLVDIVRFNTFKNNIEETFILEINETKITPTNVEGEEFIFHKYKGEDIEISVPKNSVLNLDVDAVVYDKENNIIEEEITYLPDGNYTIIVNKNDLKYTYNIKVDNDFTVSIEDTYAYSSGYIVVQFTDLNENEEVNIIPTFTSSETFNYNTEKILVPIHYDTSSGNYDIEFSSNLSSQTKNIEVKPVNYRESYFNVDYGVIEAASQDPDEDVLKAYQEVGNLITEEFYYLESGFKNPSIGVTTGDFGDVRYINGDTTPTKIHYGVDYASSLNTSIYSTAKGEVVFVGFMPAVGNTIAIDHGNGITSHYYHLEQTYVEVGEIVDNTTEIAGMGTTGYSTGVHLHFEIHINGIVVSPYYFLGK